MRNVVPALALTLLVVGPRMATGETVSPSAPAAKSEAAPTNANPGPSQVLVDLKYLADLRKELADAERALPRRDPDVEKQMWSTFRYLGLAAAAVWLVLGCLELVLAHQRSLDVKTVWKASEPEKFATHIEKAAREVMEKMTMGAPLANLEDRVRALEARKP